MEKRFLNFADIIHAENMTTETSNREIGEWLKSFENLINLLIKLNYFYDSDKLASDNDLSFLLFSFNNQKYMEAPHSLHAILSWKKAIT